MIERMTTAVAAGESPPAAAPAAVQAPDGDVSGDGPAVGWATGPLRLVQAADREIARQTALRARAVAEFVATRPSSADRQPGEPGCASPATRAARPEVLAPVSEWAAAELTIALSITRSAAEALLQRSLTLVQLLPRTLAALEAGTIHTGHLWTFLDRVAVLSEPVRGQVEAELLVWLSRRVTTPAQLSDKARRLILARDPRGAAQRLVQALRERGVSATAGREDGMSALTAVLSTPESRACLDVLGRLADSLVDPDPVPGSGGPAPRTRAQKMADCLVDLILRPGDTDLPVIQAQLTVVASVETLAGGDLPGEIDGQPVPAEVVRALARRLGLIPDEPLVSDQSPAPHQPPAADQPPAPAEPQHPGYPDAGAACGGASVDRSGRDVEAGWAALEQQLLEQVWAIEDQLVADGAWGGEGRPPEEVVRAAWEREGAWEREADWQRWLSDARLGELWDLDPDLSSAATGLGGGWAAADRTLDRAGALTVECHRALADAERSVSAAERSAQDDEEEWSQSRSGRLSRTRDSLAALGACAAAQRAAIGALLMRTGGGGLADRPRIALADALSGTLLALTDATELRRHAHCGRAACRRRVTSCTHDLTGRPALGPPPETPGYRPSAALDRFVRTRDRRCRFPGCRMPVRTGELDHHDAHPRGRTAAGNLTGYCTHHHRGKHQAPGWTHQLDPDGTLTVTTPSGLTASTTPPPLDDRTDDRTDEPPPY